MIYYDDLISWQNYNLYQQQWAILERKQKNITQQIRIRIENILFFPPLLLMKKVYDWDIGLVIQIQNNSKTLKLVCSIHTTVHQLKIQICKKLNLPVFDTEIDLYGGNLSNSWRPLKPTSSLQQNGIENKQSRIRAVIRRQKENPLLDIKVEQNHNKKETQKSIKVKEGIGLSLVASCVNNKCINYQQDSKIHLGHGSFPFPLIVSDLKCQVCPYRSQFLRPTMMCKAVRLNNCLYKLDGSKTDPQGIPTQKNTNFASVKGEKDILSKLTSDQWDRNITLIVKSL